MAVLVGAYALLYDVHLSGKRKQIRGLLRLFHNIVSSYKLHVEDKNRKKTEL